MKLLAFLLVLLTSDVWAQSEKMASYSTSDCHGATAILTPGTYSLQFSGNAGNKKDLEAYPSLKTIAEKNSAWCYFIAPFDGRLTLDATISSGLVQLIAFQNDEADLCEGLFKGSTEVKRLIQQPTESTVSLSLIVNANSLYPMDLKKDQKVMFLFNTQEKGKPVLDFNLKYEGLNGAGNNTNNEENTKIVDMRKSKTAPALNITVRDVETGNPVIADLVVAGSKTISGLYAGSDFFFAIDKSGKLTIKCDAPGYFFVDREESVSANTEHELVIWLQPLGAGKSMRIEEIEFMPGTSEFMPTADAKLRRLKDFLALNSGIKIEIQGHVHSLGDNTQSGQKLSEARAKRVLNYLIENGIDKERMTAVGYGNTMPIYAKPQFSYEEQANRRVEIKIL